MTIVFGRMLLSILGICAGDFLLFFLFLFGQHPASSGVALDGDHETIWNARNRAQVSYVEDKQSCPLLLSLCLRRFSFISLHVNIH